MKSDSYEPPKYQLALEVWEAAYMHWRRETPTTWVRGERVAPGKWLCPCEDCTSARDCQAREQTRGEGGK